MTDKATIEDFLKLDLRVGKILQAENLPKAKKPAYKLQIDFGPLGIKNSSAQITDVYAAQDLIGRLVVAVVNFPPRRIAGFMSEVLVLGCNNEDQQVVLLQPERPVPLGSRIY